MLEIRNNRSNSLTCQAVSINLSALRLSMDIKKTCAGVCRYTAINNCGRFRVLGSCPRSAGKHTWLFLDRSMEQMPFPIQRTRSKQEGNGIHQGRRSYRPEKPRISAAYLYEVWLRAGVHVDRESPARVGNSDARCRASLVVADARLDDWFGS